MHDSVCSQGDFSMTNKIIKKAIQAPEFLNEPIEYNKSFSRGIRVDCGEMTMLFISGTASVDEKGETFEPDNFTAQAMRTFDNLTGLLAAEGATWHDVVKTGCFIKDMKYYDAFNDYRNEFYKKLSLDPFPASFCVQTELCRPELLIEIELTVIIRK